MPLITKSIFKELAEVRQRPCISIYIPTSRSGENKDSRIRFKNKVQEVRKELEGQGMQQKQVQEFTQPFEMLLEDGDAWRHMSDGLAVFLSPGKFAYSVFPVRFKEYAEVNTYFYLLPLIPVFNGDGQFFVLALSLNQVRLFEGTRDHIGEIAIEDLVPQTLQDTVGHDYEQKSLQFRTGQSGQGKSVYHGQGGGKDHKKEEIVKHLREVDRSLNKVLRDYDAPLVVACVDYVFALYKTVNTYNHLYPKNISGNPDEEHMESLHQKAWTLLRDEFEKHRKEALRQYEFLLSKGRTASIIDDVVAAAKEGRIETVFIEKNQSLWGRMDKESGKVIVEEEKSPDNHCLLDRIAKETFLQGGKVYIQNPEEMPADTLVAASLRY
ncbi:MAG: hypothetical protein ACLFS0_01750 [Bacteroidales bacterium]